MSVLITAQKIACSVRSIAFQPNQRSHFISESIKKAKELQRKNVQEYELHLSCLLCCLELFDIFHCEAYDILCELTILDILFSLDLSSVQLSSCNSYVRLCLEAVGDTHIAVAAVKTFSETLTMSMATDFVRTQIDDAVNWISFSDPKKKAQCICGILVLTEVALRIPMLILPKLSDIFERLWDCLAIIDPETQERSLTLFTLCAKLLGNLSNTAQSEAYGSLLSQLKNNLATKTREKNVAGLLAFTPLVQNGMNLRSPPRYEDLSIMLVPYIMGGAYSSNLSEVMRELLFRCLIVLCRYSTNLFITNQLKETMHYALDSIQKRTQHCAALDMLSEIIPIVGRKAFFPFSQETCNSIKGIFEKSDCPCWEALRCFAKICQLCPPEKIEMYIDVCIENVFSWGLSTQLVECMREIVSSSSHQYRAKLEESLLDIISITLCGLPFRQQSGNEKIPNLGHIIDPSDYQISVALNAFMQFGFSNSELMGEFLRDSVLPFIDHTSPAVRNAAVNTIVKMLIPPGDKGSLSITRRICIDNIIARMLTVGTTNPNSLIRRTLLQGFTEYFFPYLSEPHFLFHFYTALGDECIHCRVASLVLLCRMVDYEPSHILPALRKEMVTILQRISSSCNDEVVQDGLRLLAAAASTAPQFVVSFKDSISDVLTPHFSNFRKRVSCLRPLLHCATAFCRAVRLFYKDGVPVQDQIASVCELLDAYPAERTYYSLRLSCLRFLSTALGPLVNGETPFKVYPHLFRQLSTILRSNEEYVDIRLEALRCFGSIGALDAHLFQSIYTIESGQLTAGEMPLLRSVTHMECCRCVLRALASLLDHHSIKRASGNRDTLLKTAVQTVLYIADHCPFSRREIYVVVEPLARVIVELPSGPLLGTIFYEFTNIARYSGEAVLSNTDIIFTVFNTIWESQPNLRFLAVRLASVLATLELSSDQNYGSYHSQILPLIFESLNSVQSSDFLKYSVLEYIMKHVAHLQPCTDTIVNELLSLIQNPTNSEDFTSLAVIVLREVCRKLYVDDFVGAIVRCLLCSLSLSLSKAKGSEQDSPSNLYMPIMSVFNVLIVQLQGNFIPFSPFIIQTLKTYCVSNTEFAHHNTQVNLGKKCAASAKVLHEYNNECTMLLRQCEQVMISGLAHVGEGWSYFTSTDEANAPTSSMGNEEEKILIIAEQHIATTIKTVPLTKEEWLKWMDQFALVILRESPFQVFRCVSMPLGINASPLAERSQPFLYDIFQSAFQSLWLHSSAKLQCLMTEFFRQTLKQAMATTMTVPDEVVTVLLSLVEYMDHVGQTLSISLVDLSECAWKRGMLAKALYWLEAAYRESPASTEHSLISLYSELHNVDSAVGILNMASEDHRQSLRESSLLKLARYTEALQLTQQEIENDGGSESSSTESLSKPFSQRGCSFRAWHPMLHNRSTLDSVASLSKSEENSSQVNRRLEARTRLMLCLSELGDCGGVLKEWDLLYKRYGEQDAAEEKHNVLFYVSQYAADACLRLQSWDTMEKVLKWMPRDSVMLHIAKTAWCIHEKSYDEAMMFLSQGRKALLDDLSGLLQDSYGRAYEGLVVAQQLTELEEVIRAKRVELQTGSTDHIRILSKLWDQRIRMMSPTVSAWKQVLGVRGLLIPPSNDVKTRLRFVKLCRHEDATLLERFTLEQLLGHESPTYEQLMSRSMNPRVVMQYITYLSASKQLGPKSSFGSERDLIMKMIDLHSEEDNYAILSRAYARLGTKVGSMEAVQSFRTAILYDSKWNLAWRMWAEANSEILNEEYSDEACSNSIQGYIQSIQLGTCESTFIQDVLKLLTLWSRHCDREKGLKELRKHVFDVPPRVWHLVLPQLIARLDSGSDNSCHLVADILTSVAIDYPHTIIYPLNLCTVSDSVRRKQWANEILNELQQKYPVIVIQGQLMINELIRISSLLHEKWYLCLEDAAEAFFGRRNCEETIRLLMPIHESLQRAPETIFETEFLAKYSKLLDEAKEWMRAYAADNRVGGLQSAWRIYHSVHKQISEQIKTCQTLQMQFCSPKLFEARNLSIGLPDARSTTVESVSKIAQFHDLIAVIASKQRPKRIALTTQEGKTQKFLLKGREDLRLDERVMQLFGLINTLMLSDPRSSKNSGFQIQRYSVTPLKDTVGLIGWIDGCDTLYEMVKSYRTCFNILPDLEFRMLKQIITYDNAKAYDYLSIMSKVEVTEFLSDHTSGHDIRKAMWSSAPSSEVWLDQRHMFTTSLATMSVVGYILGLGDRHPNNIMIQKTTGLVVHIDFGDCFEVAMTREKFPEKVPFRLTRMLRNALDVAGMDGTFGSIAISAMCVLRENSDSLLALLEAFIHDPLISWRLINRPGQEPESSNDHVTFAENIIKSNLQPQADKPTLKDSFYASSNSEKKNSPTSVTKHLFREEVDVVHQGIFILNRLSSKLKGLDFIITDKHSTSLDPKIQVARLVAEATDITNIAQSWLGWYPFW